LNDFVIGGERFQNVGGGGNGFALAIFHRRGQSQVFKQNLAQLLRRADVEWPAGKRVNLPGKRADPGFHDGREAGQLGSVDAHAVRFHARQHGGERQLDLVVQRAQAARLDLRREQLKKLERDIGALLGGSTQLDVQFA